MFKLSAVLAPQRPEESLLALKDKIAYFKDVGLEGIEPSIPDPWRIDIKALRDMVDEYGLKVSAISTGLGYVWHGWSLSSGSEEVRKKAIEAIKKHIENAQELGAPVIIGLIRGYGEEPLEACMSRFKESLRECIAHAEDHGITLLIEPINRYETRLLNKVDDVIKLIKEMGSDKLRLMVDTYHMNIEERNIGVALMRSRKYLAYVHVADNNRLAPGYGHVDFKSIMGILKEMGYDSFLSLEILPFPDFRRAIRDGAIYLRMLMKLLSNKSS
ncbi:MAG: sugar phosphate isomerase/epimerase [Thermoprotei archaeon]|nr:MAG: sugar phosphate isomerase/epimerase [Thermoprotei archaeon]